MDIKEYMQTVGRQARAASRRLAGATTAEKNAALLHIAAAIRREKAALVAANQEDLAGVADSASVGTVTAAQLVVLRHGRTAWNATGLLQGQADIPLDERGLAHLRDLRGELAAGALAEAFDQGAAVAGAHRDHRAARGAPGGA